jgi:hypothetical protein
MTCKNCNTPVSGHYCSACGQQAHIHRVTIAHLGHELIHALTHTDKGFLILIKELLTRPGVVAREYLDGQRKRYFNPLSFLVITTAFYAYIAYKTGYFTAISAGNSPRPVQPYPYYNEMMEVMVNNGKLLSLILIVPLLAFMTWISFLRSRFNLAEAFVLQSYIIGQANVARVLIFIPVFLLAPTTIQWNMLAFQVVFVVYMTIAYKQFFETKLVTAAIKAIIIHVLFIVFYWLLILGFIVLEHAILS